MTNKIRGKKREKKNKKFKRKRLDNQTNHYQ